MCEPPRMLLATGDPLLPRLTHDVLLADPGRPHLKGFLERAAADWSVARTGTLYHLSRS